MNQARREELWSQMTALSVNDQIWLAKWTLTHLAANDEFPFNSKEFEQLNQACDLVEVVEKTRIGEAA